VQWSDGVMSQGSAMLGTELPIYRSHTSGNLNLTASGRVAFGVHFFGGPGSSGVIALYRTSRPYLCPRRPVARRLLVWELTVSAIASAPSAPITTAPHSVAYHGQVTARRPRTGVAALGPRLPQHVAPLPLLHH
jgi:hypothetical protein